MSGSRHNMYYIAGRIDDESKFKAIRDDVYDHINASHNNYIKRTPHVTFVNRIKLPESYEKTVDNEIDKYNPSAIPVKAVGFSTWPSIDNPRYISLDVTAPIQAYQDEISKIIKQNEGQILTDPPKPHITLCKCETPEDVTEHTKTQLEKLNELNFTIHTHIPYIDLLDSQINTEKNKELNSQSPILQLND